MSRQYMVSLEVCKTKLVTYSAEDDRDAVDKAKEIAASIGEHGDTRVDWVHELRPVHHG